ncbi:MAG TPA: NAD(P)/FAD-dependent oxidoreductase, partial [Burkholderiaceae bacterium]|nr:NAD(P)/FAD-dependent oxidoreductase [Burkholderiaceae bacterium]
MLDVAIIGGGLCGLALAHSLQARGSDWRLYEARERLGGRVLTAKASDGTPVDLGPTWFWPDSQPAITR